MASWNDESSLRSRWREHVLDVLPLVVALVALVLFLVFWHSSL
jgi:hypothetical protein